MSGKQIPAWLDSRLYNLKRQGRMILTNEPKLATHFADLSTPAAYRALSVMSVLDMSRNDITSIEGLRHFPKLKHFLADSTNIADLRNFRVLEGVNTISLQKTPVAEKEHFRLGLLLVVGDSLKSINGRVITATLVKRAATYPPICRELVNHGWIPTYPCPEQDELDELCRQYGLEPEPGVPPDSDSVVEEEINEDEEEEIEFEKVLQNLRKDHALMTKKGEALFGIVTPDELAANAVSTILKSHGVEFDDNNDDQIVEAVKTLCTDVNH